MATTSNKKTAKNPDRLSQRYFERLSRRWVYGSLLGLLILAVGLLLFVPHFKPLTLASQDEINQAHHDIINKYFLKDTLCPAGDNLSHDQRVKSFNAYFKVNQYANRAVVRGCNDTDQMLAKMDNGKWLPTDVNIRLDTRQNPQWQKECLIDDITVADDKVRPENGSIDAFNLSTCNKLRRESYIEVNLSVHFHK